LAKLPDGRTQVQITQREPGGGTQPVGAARATTEAFVAALTAVLSGKPVDSRLTGTRVYLFTAPTGSDLHSREHAISDLRHCLNPLPIEMVPDAAKARAQVWLEAASTTWREGLTVRLTVPGTRYSTQWIVDSPRDIGKARDIKHLFSGWLNANRERLATGRRTQPLPEGRACVAQAAPPPSATSASFAKVALFLGPAAATDGFVSFSSGFSDSYRDLCEEYKGDRSFRSALTIVTDRNAADLILEITSRDTTGSFPNAALRAVLLVVGDDTIAKLNGQAGVDWSAYEPRVSAWRLEANSLLRQTVNWIQANGGVIEKARAGRVPRTQGP
jgi:hypothetical protein